MGKLRENWSLNFLNRSPLQAVIFLLLFFFPVIFFVGREEVVRAASLSETLWGIKQDCDFDVQDPEYSIDGQNRGFDDQTASCAGDFAAGKKSWRYTAFQPTSLSQVVEAKLEARFLMTGLVDDRVNLEISDGDQWYTLEEFRGQKNPPPAMLTTLSVDVSSYLDSPEKVDHASMRFVGKKTIGQPDTISIILDGARLVTNGELYLTETPTPTDAILTSTALPPTPTLDPTIPSGTTTPSPPPVSTVIPIATPTPPSSLITPEPTSAPPASNTLEFLWGIAQECDYIIVNPEMSLDQLFDDQTAFCTGEFGKETMAWQYTMLQRTNITIINNVALEVRFYMLGLVDDRVNLEIFDGTQWIILEQFGADNSPVPAALTTLVFDVTSNMNSSANVNQAAVRFVGENHSGMVDTITIALDEVRLLVSGTYETADIPTPTASATVSPTLLATPDGTSTPMQQELGPPFPRPQFAANALASVQLAGEPHRDNSGTTDSCAACHIGHNANGITLRRQWPEEMVCFSCHSAGGNGTNVEPAFTNYPNSPAGYFAHDVLISNGVHRLSQSSPSDFSGENRHVECEDCHDPHYSARGEGNPPMVQPEMVSVSGVEPDWTGPGAPNSFTWMSESDHEYQVCLKCHSTFTTLPDYQPDGWNGTSIVTNGLRKLTSSDPLQVPDSRDLSQEFNPFQASYHPLATMGRNQNISPESFVAGWSQTSLVYCSDCHTNVNGATEGSGPHGSPRLHILDGQAEYSTVVLDGSPRVSNQELCFKCHNYQTYVTGQNESTHFKLHDKHMDNNWGTTCYTCHDSHGSEQLHLINLDVSVATPLNGRDSQTAWYYDPGSGKAGCYVDCHGDKHDPEEYEP